MPLTSAIQSAMAIRNEREKRQQRRMSKIRRESGVGSTASTNENVSQRPSVTSLGACDEVIVQAPTDKSDSTLTTFHMGIVFILLGFLMIFSSMIPSSLIKADWSRLLGVGVAFIFIGLIMVMVNRIITAREEEELSKYVKQRLSRTRSGQAFVRDPECGNLVIPEIVKPPPIPSAMKGAGGHPPRSPKDKVTFAEFNDEKEPNGIHNGIHDNGNTKSVPDRNIPDILHIPSELNIPKVNILEPSSESQRTSSPEEDRKDLNGTLESVSSASMGPPSPTCETQSLLPEDPRNGNKKILRKKVY